MRNMIEKFQNIGIKIWKENDKIKFSGPKDKINREFLSFLKENKEQILTYLSTADDNNQIATKNQMALWLERKMGNTSGVIHNGMIKGFNGELDIAKVNSAFDKILDRHEALNCTFYENNNEVCVKLSDIKTSYFTYEKLTNKNEKESYDFVKEEINKTLDLENGPLFRVGIYEYSENKYYIAIWAHHIISDAYSLFIIEKEFYKFYDELVNNEEHTFDNVASYISTVTDESIYLNGKEYEDDFKYWKNNLDSTVLGTTLPKYKIMNENEPNYIPGTLIDKLSDETSTKINLFARENHLTPYILVFSVFNLLLSFSNEERINSLGVFVANRLKEQYLNQVGYFSNAIVFQNETNKDDNFLQYVTGVKKRLLQSFGHQQLPLTELIEKLNPTRSNGMPFFNIAFDSLLFSNDNEKDELQRKLNFTDVDLVKGSGNYDLIVWLSFERNCYSLEYRYNCQMFDKYQIESLAESINGILSNLYKIQNENLTHIPLLYGKNEELIATINNTEANFSEENIFSCVKRQCDIYGDRLAVDFYGNDLSYSEMERLIDLFCCQLSEKGIGKGSYVGVMLKKSEYLLPAILSIWAVGAVYVPIDPNFPVNRKEYIISNTNLSAIIKESEEKLNTISTIINVEDVAEIWINDKNRELKYDYTDNDSELDTPAYILYTSGSTGNPKGVVISHRAFMNFLTYMKSGIALNENDKVLSITSICFDISLLEMFLPLVVGAGVVMISYEDSMNGRKILETIEKQSVTVMQATPTTFEILYDYYIEEEYKSKILKKCLCGGESYELSLVQKLQKMSNIVFNVYGPTETTIWSTIYEIPNPCNKLRLGNPIANTKIRIADAKGRQLPIGFPGELLIGGTGLFMEYYDNPELTQQVLIKANDGELLYKTGDWAYFSENGELNFLGRKDSQIKIRGFRIEISEIENVFRKHESVSNVAVVTLQRNNTTELVAIVIPKNNIKLDVNQINNFISQYLPSYMMPNHILIQDSFPMTNNNKIDRKAIKDIVGKNHNNVNSLKNFDENETETESQIKVIWSNILNNQIFSLEEGFFEMGGNSILLNKLAIELEKKFNKKIEIIKLLKFNTVRKMASYIDDNFIEKKQENKKIAESVQRRNQYINRRKK
ncbi:MAG: amino acid adenylation domain-containing protein [Acutalibacteraceae bacterium]|nr:amino acid adenylation domain-containing protein [Acutalibacteraceae bacterium]